MKSSVLIHFKLSTTYKYLTVIYQQM